MFLIILLLLIITNEIKNETKIPIKIIQEPVNFEFQSNLINHNLKMDNNNNNNNNMILKSAYLPSEYSGPEQFKQLIGKCFEYLNKNYKWIVCPFHNVTQYEIANRWNPYKGILGIYYEWEITSIDNKFKSMLFINGDDCGSNIGKRSTKVTLICNNNNETTTTPQIFKVNEPTTCKYEIEMYTQLACEQDDQYTMFVYPHLPNLELKLKMNAIYTDYYKLNLITDKMFNLNLMNIFKQAKFIQYDQDRMLIDNNQQQQQQQVSIEEEESIYNNLTKKELIKKLITCQNENKDLKQAIARYTYSFS
jgi:N-acetylglucosamine-1-phosphate transferase, gamma subunit